MPLTGCHGGFSSSRERSLGVILFFARALLGVILFFAPALLGRSEWDRVLTSEPVGGILILGLTEPTPGENNI
jgi:hypothetical protein